MATEVVTVLVVAPHPDDEVLGCGGSICVHVADGRRVAVAYLTSGENGSPVHPPEVMGPIREAEAREAMRVLGVSEADIHFLRFPDGRLNEADEGQFLRLIQLIRALRPLVMYVPHAGEASFDHRQAHFLTMRAADMAQSMNYRVAQESPAWRIPVILGYEVWTPLGSYQYLEPITPFGDKKVEALETFQSQSKEIKRQSTYIGPAGVALSLYRGAMARGGYAEAFTVIRADTLFTGLPATEP